jgi:hypothetical protein
MASIGLINPMVSASLYRGGIQDIVEIGSIGMFIHPLPNCVEHITLDFNGPIADHRMMKGSKDIIHDFLDGDINVLPGIDYARGHVLQNSRGHSPSTRIQLVRKVVL